MAEIQAALLDRATGWLKPGGSLLYATCSLEPAEGEEQIAALCARQPGLAPQPIDPAALPAGIAPSAPGQLRTLPGTLAEQGGIDGFFVAQLHRF
jgi:16S rRNA (cytosine967-C5)-methyltransferase